MGDHVATLTLTSLLFSSVREDDLIVEMISISRVFAWF